MKPFIGMPFIGIPCRPITDPNSDYGTQGVRTPYLESIIAAGGIPLLIPLCATDKYEGVLRAYFNACGGILLAGGEDVDPAYYGEKPHPKLGEICAERDKTEITLVQWARAEKKPLLGICRGIQVVNVALGGTLYQDLQSQKGCASPHKDDRWEEDAHTVSISSGCRLSSIMGDASYGVNSLHHQAVKDVAPGLKVTATSDDEIVEAVELDVKDHFFMAVQWHPEAMWQRRDPKWLNLFKSFVENAAR